MLGIEPSPDVWRWQPHLEVWLLVVFLIGAFVYAVRVIGPHAVPAGTPAVTRRTVLAFGAAMLVLWVASDWPVHDLGEEYLYWVHMVQHMALVYFLPPLVWLATPEWLARTLVGSGALYRVVRWCTHPVIAAVGFNVMVMITHVPLVVNASTENGPLHYSLHVALVVTSLLFWLPVCGPFQELRLKPGPTMVYLFAASVVPTVPAGWLAFSEGVVYDHYDMGVRVGGISVTADQQLAGVIMKLGGSVYLWTIITILFFKRFMGGFEKQFEERKRVRMPDAEITRTGLVEEPRLTYDEVTRVFEAVPAAAEPGERPG